MNDPSAPAEPKDQRVQAALGEYLERVDRGEAVDLEEFLSRHAEIADQLRSFIAAGDEVRKLAAAEIPGHRAEDSTKSFAGRGQETVAPQSMAKRTAESGGTGLTGQFGRYRIIWALGKGAMGTVYLAEDTHIERQVALKTPHFTEDPTGEQTERFFREARAAGNLRHPHICPIYDFGQIDGKHFITMAYIEGRPLSALIQPDKPQSERKILIVIRKLALALQAAHDKGIVHRDLKPANIMVDTSSEPIIMDFGLARQARRDEDIRLTQTGNILGTPAFMSPEQVDGDPEKIGPPTDQYSLGVILYELLTGQLPFQGSVIAVMGQILTKEPARPSQLRPEMDQRVEAICLKMMAKTPPERFASLKAVADELATILKSPASKAASKEKPASLPGPFLICEIDEADRLNDRPTALKKAVDLLRVKPGHHRAREIQEKYSGYGEGGAARIGVLDQFRRPLNEGGWIPWSVLAFGLAVFGVITGVFVVYLGRTAVVIDIKDPGVEVAVKGTTLTVTGPDKQSVKVVPGDQELTISSAGLETTTKSFTIKKGEKKTVTVSIVDSKLVARLENEIAQLTPAPEEKTAATLPTRTQRNASPLQGTMSASPQPTLGDTLPETGEKGLNLLPPGGAAKTKQAGHDSGERKEPLDPFDGTDAGDLRELKDLKIAFRWCPPGRFMMGSPKSEVGNSVDENQVEVMLPRGFWMQETEVTQSEWVKLMDSLPSQEMNKGKGDRYPIYYVSLDDATRFCRKLTDLERNAGRLPSGWECRLPTEAEWEYACRAGTTTATAFGDTLSSAQANFNGDWPHNGAPKGPNLQQAVKVGSYRPNNWGIYDMHGNVKEFTTTPGRVRGGSWYDSGRNCCSAIFIPDPPTASESVGFRVVLVSVP
jgi:serine/threonine protein kinase